MPETFGYAHEKAHESTICFHEENSPEIIKTCSQNELTLEYLNIRYITRGVSC